MSCMNLNRIFAMSVRGNVKRAQQRSTGCKVHGLCQNPAVHEKSCEAEEAECDALQALADALDWSASSKPGLARQLSAFHPTASAPTAAVAAAGQDLQRWETALRLDHILNRTAYIFGMSESRDCSDRQITKIIVVLAPFGDIGMVNRIGWRHCA